MNQPDRSHRPVPSGTFLTMDEELTLFALDPVPGTDVPGPYCMVTLPCSRATLHRVLLNAPRAQLEHLSEVGEDGLRCCLVTEVLAFGLLGLRSLRLPEEREELARELLAAAESPPEAPTTGEGSVPGNRVSVSGTREPVSGTDRLVVSLLRERVDRAFGFSAPAGSGRVRFLVPRPRRSDRSG